MHHFFQKLHPDHLDSCKKNRSTSAESGEHSNEKDPCLNLAPPTHRPNIQTELNDKVLRLIINKMLPLSILDGDEFEDIIRSKYLYELQIFYYKK